MKLHKAFALLGFFSAFLGSAAGAQSLVSQTTDASGKITVGVFEMNYAAHYGAATHVIDVPDPWVVIGGGLETRELPGCPPIGSCPTPYSESSIHLLVTSAPILPQMDGWQVTEKQHLYFQWGSGTVYAIAIQVQGLTRAQLLSNIAVSSATSSSVSHPDVSVGVPSGYVMIGGGISISYSGSGNLATALYPETASSWRVQSKDHVDSSPGQATAYSIALPAYIAGVGNIGVTTVAASSSWQSKPSSYVGLTSGYALTGCGASVNYAGGAGAMIWKVRPATTGGLYGCDAGSKDLKIVSTSSITTYAMGIYAY